MLKRGTPVIINDVDCPQTKLVAVLRNYDSKRGVWKADYLSASTMRSKCTCSGFMGEPTPIADFGRKIKFDGARDRYQAVPTGDPCTATYVNGDPRQWQESGRPWIDARQPAVTLFFEEQDQENS